MVLFPFFFQNEERKVVSGNTESKNNILLPLQLQLAGQMCFKISRSAALFAAFVYFLTADMVLGLGE